MAGQVPPAVVAERYERLVALVEQLTLAENEAFIGRPVEVLVADGEGRKDQATRRMSGRARDNRLVHFSPSGPDGPAPDDPRPPRPGDVIVTMITKAAPHYLIADGSPLSVRRTAGGEAWQARTTAATAQDGGSVHGRSWPDEAPRPGAPVLLGMPAVGRPAAP